MTEVKVKEPLFHVSKRDVLPLKKAILIRASAVISGLLFVSLLCSLLTGNSILDFFIYLFKGTVGSSENIWIVIRNTAILLGVGLALVPAFKMKFWNLGGNGQIMMGLVATIACMYYLGGKLPDGVINIFMIIASITAGAIWAIIPAIFKVFFKTNESLFTLMMNYIAIGIAEIAVKSWATSQTGTLDKQPYGNLPVIGNQYVLSILVALLLLGIIYCYLKYSKHGYEVSVVGESENTARYVGINVKKVVIRTMALSGAICGIIGLLLGGSINHNMIANLTEGKTSTNFMNIDLGFTAIMVAWLAKFNPLMMILTSLLVTFMTKGMATVKTNFGLGDDAIANLVIGLLYFFIIGCEFFVRYKIKIKKNKRKDGNFLTPENNQETNKTTLAEEQELKDALQGEENNG